MRCELCGGERSRTRLTKLGLSLRQCRSCGLVFSYPKLDDAQRGKRYGPEFFFGEYLPTFKADAASFSLGIVKDHYSVFLGLLSKSSGTGRRLLDVGCGAGFFVKAAESEGWSAEGTEISEAAADYGRGVTRIPVHLGRLEDLGLRPESYDVVTMLDIVEHLTDPLGTLREAHRLLKPGGSLILSTPDFGSLSRTVLGRNWAVLSPVEHLFYFTDRTLLRCLHEAGWRAVTIRNLLQFIPDYTHRRDYLRSRVWKAAIRRLEKTGLMEKIHRYEYFDLLFSGDDPALNPWVGKIQSPLKKRIYRKMKGLLRGDGLTAVAVKDQGPEEMAR